jgi:uncharacterized membrane protein
MLPSSAQYEFRIIDRGENAVFLAERFVHDLPMSKLPPIASTAAILVQGYFEPGTGIALLVDVNRNATIK